MRRIYSLLLILTFSCSNNGTVDQSDNFWKDKKYKAVDKTIVFSPRTDSIYFNIDSIRTKCRKTSAFSFENTETTELKEISSTEFKNLFKNIRVNVVHTELNYGRIKIGQSNSYDFTNDNANYFEYWYNEYFENDSLLLFTIGIFETTVIDKYIIFVLDKKTGQLVNTLDDLFSPLDKPTFISSNKNTYLLTVKYDQGEEAKDGSYEEAWIDSLTIEFKFDFDGTIRRTLLAAKDKMIKAG